MWADLVGQEAISIASACFKPISSADSCSAANSPLFDRLTACASGPPPCALSLLLGAFDPERAEAGVFIADVGLKSSLFFVEDLDRVHIGELQ
jgi:hypothetical protein